MELTILNLTKKYGTKLAVNNVTAKFEPGIIGLLGANGSGKTTLMRMLVDVLKPQQGSIMWDGKEIHSHIESYLFQLGYLPQHIGVYPTFTVLQFLMYIGTLKGLKPAYTKMRIDELLTQFHLNEQKNKRIKQLSGGMKQRLGIIQCLLNDPPLIILDEPTVGLDPKERNHFSQMLSSISKDKIILISTHIVSDIENIANKIIIMKNGSFIHYDSPEILLQQLNGKVYEQEVELQELESMQKSIILCHQKNIGDKLHVRFIQDTENTKAMPVLPTLNDVYLYHFQEVTG